MKERRVFSSFGTFHTVSEEEAQRLEQQRNDPNWDWEENHGFGNTTSNAVNSSPYGGNAASRASKPKSLGRWLLYDALESDTHLGAILRVPAWGLAYYFCTAVSIGLLFEFYAATPNGRPLVGGPPGASTIGALYLAGLLLFWLGGLICGALSQAYCDIILPLPFALFLLLHVIFGGSSIAWVFAVVCEAFECWQESSED